jgi:hypothetical protein
MTMRIAFASDSVLPATKYGGIERIVWWLAKQLSSRGHGVTLLAPPGSRCPFARVVVRDSRLPLAEQVPADVDIVHLQGGEAGPFHTDLVI